MGREKSKWVTHEIWICPNHVPAVRLGDFVEDCWYINCMKRPPMEERPGPEYPLCAWKNCDKGPRGRVALSREKSKYCSKNCSNKNARNRYQERKSEAA